MVTVLASNVVVWIRWCNGYRARLECGSMDSVVYHVENVTFDKMMPALYISL
jgi:hypothetical protein